MQIVTTENEHAAAAQEDQAPDSPLKIIRRGPTQPSMLSTRTFRHFSQRNQNKISDSDIFAVRLSHDAEMAAVSLFDGSLQIVSTMVGNTLYEIHDDNMSMPITSLTWKPTRDGYNPSQQKLLGACLNGSIVRWTPGRSGEVEHIVLNRD